MRLLTLIAGTFFLIPQVVFADTVVVNWTGNYVSADQNLSGNAFIGNGIDYDNDASSNDEIGGTAFSTSNPFSPSTGYSGTSARFYGGAVLARKNYSGADTAFDNAFIEDSNLPKDSIHLHAQKAGDWHDMHAILLWQQPDFLNGGVPITFTSSSFAHVDLGTSPTGGMKGANFRLIVRDNDDKYWLSKTAFDSLGANQQFTWDNSNQGFSSSSDGEWASYDPTKEFSNFGSGTDLRFDENSTYTDKKFGSITAVGLFYNQDFDVQNLDLHIEHFQVNAVPEPTAFGLLAGFALIASARLRRRVG